MNIEFWFDFGSPTAYLANCRLAQLAQKYGATIERKPMLLGGVFKAAGSASPATVPAKGQYMFMHDLPRFAARYGVELNFNPHFPINTLNLMRGVYAARELDCEDTYIDAMFDAIWVKAENMGDLDVCQRVMTGAGLDAEAIMAKVSEPEVKQALIDATEAAVAKGIFGTPTMFIGDDMYFGQDRLDFVEERLSA